MTAPSSGGCTFADRAEAGQVLASALASYRDRPDVVVLGLPRGGVPVAYQVATALAAPLDVFLVRKLGVPGHAELAMGAIAPGGVRVLNDSVVSSLRISESVIDEVALVEEAELERRSRAYRGDRPPLELGGRTVVVVDDGLATGATMRAAVAALRAFGPASVVVGVPVGAATTCRDLRQEADDVVCARAPAFFQAVGEWYVDFSPTTGEEIRRLLRPAAAPDEP